MSHYMYCYPSGCLPNIGTYKRKQQEKTQVGGIIIAYEDTSLPGELSRLSRHQPVTGSQRDTSMLVVSVKPTRYQPASGINKTIKIPACLR